MILLLNKFLIHIYYMLHSLKYILVYILYIYLLKLYILYKYLNKLCNLMLYFLQMNESSIHKLYIFHLLICIQLYI